MIVLVRSYSAIFPRLCVCECLLSNQNENEENKKDQLSRDLISHVPLASHGKADTCAAPPNAVKTITNSHRQCLPSEERKISLGSLKTLVSHSLDRSVLSDTLSRRIPHRRRKQKCYVSLVENLNIDDVDCIKYSLSKGLGVGIVAGGSIMKVPQLLLSTPLSPRHLLGLRFTTQYLEPNRRVASP